MDDMNIVNSCISSAFASLICIFVLFTCILNKLHHLCLESYSLKSYKDFSWKLFLPPVRADQASDGYYAQFFSIEYHTYEWNENEFLQSWVLTLCVACCDHHQCRRLFWWLWLLNSWTIITNDQNAGFNFYISFLSFIFAVLILSVALFTIDFWLKFHHFRTFICAFV